MNYINIDNNKLKELAKKTDTILIDIRTKEEFEEEKIEGAINIPLQNLIYDIEELTQYKDKSIIVYCRSGHRSITACNLLEIEGFKNVYNLEKGIIEFN